MGQSSQGGALALRTQAVKGTPMADIGTAGVAMLTRGGTLTPNRELIITDAEIGGGRDVNDVLPGGVSYSGDIEFYLRFEAIGTLLRACFGTVESTTATGVTTHVFTPSDAAQLPFLTVFQRFGASLETAMYSDAVVNSMHLECDANGLVMGTANLIARNQVLGVPDLDLDDLWDTTSISQGGLVNVLFDNVNAKGKAFSIDITNNFEDDDFRLGQRTLEDLTPKRRDVTGTLTVRHENASLMRRAVNGSAVATTPLGRVTTSPLEVEILSAYDIPAVTPATPYSLNIEFGEAVVEPFGLEPSGDEIIEGDISLRMIRRSMASPISTITLKNAVATLA